MELLIVPVTRSRGIITRTPEQGVVESPTFGLPYLHTYEPIIFVIGFRHAFNTQQLAENITDPWLAIAVTIRARQAACGNITQESGY
jgi:hypothetical protein